MTAVRSRRVLELCLKALFYLPLQVLALMQVITMFYNAECWRGTYSRFRSNCFYGSADYIYSWSGSILYRTGDNLSPVTIYIELKPIIDFPTSAKQKAPFIKTPLGTPSTTSRWACRTIYFYMVNKLQKHYITISQTKVYRYKNPLQTLWFIYSNCLP